MGEKGVRLSGVIMMKRQHISCHCNFSKSKLLQEENAHDCSLPYHPMPCDVRAAGSLRLRSVSAKTPGDTAQ